MIISGVINEINPEVIIIAEGPNKTEELQTFFDEYITGTWKTFIQPSEESSQCMGVAIRIDTYKFEPNNEIIFLESQTISALTTYDSQNPDNGIIEKYKFERFPVYVEIRLLGNKKIRILGIHLNGKGVFSPFDWSKWLTIADINRKIILAQCSQIRQNFADEYLTNVKTKDIPLIICGNINDGPGMNFDEKKLFGSGIERLMGNVWKPKLALGNAIYDAMNKRDKGELNFEKIFTASFKDPLFNGVQQKVWSGHILYSHIDLKWVNSAKIHHKMSDGKAINKKYRYSSNHVPISVQISL